jgi:hypothetical protein
LDRYAGVKEGLEVKQGEVIGMSAARATRTPTHRTQFAIFRLGPESGGGGNAGNLFPFFVPQ